MNDSQRIEELLHYFRMDQKEFAKKCGILPNTISNIKIGEHGISKKTFEKILTAFPEVNKSWLATGEGEMINNGLSITKLDNEVQKRHLIPLYDDVRTMGGGGGSNLYDIEQASNPTEFIDTGSWFKEATGAIRHYGESMVEYPQGCILAIKEVYERQLIIWGKFYVIETSEYRITKRVQRGKNEEYIKACSTNIETYPDGSLIHEPIDIAWEDIHKIFEVLGYVVKQSGGTVVYDNKRKY